MTELYKKKMTDIRKMSIKEIREIAKSNSKYAGHISFKDRNNLINYMLKKDLESKYQTKTRQPLNKLRNIVLGTAKKIAKTYNSSIWNISLTFHKSMKTYGGMDYAGITYDSYAYDELSWGGHGYSNKIQQDLVAKLKKIGWNVEDISSTAMQFAPENVL